MRKVYQACLAVIALLSLGALIIYRHEYNKLRYVLEVLNYFGNREAVGCNETWMDKGDALCSETEHLARNEDLGEPHPLWQRLTDGIYVYSAYGTGARRIRAIAIAKTERPDSVKLSCDFVHFGEGFQTISIPGKLSLEPIALRAEKKDGTKKNKRKETYEGLFLDCDYLEGENTTYEILRAVRFSAKRAFPGENGLLNEMTMPLFVRELDDRDDEGKDSSEKKEMTAGLCVTSFDSNAKRFKEMMDFMAFHKSFGFDHFISYDFGGIAPQFEKIINRQLRKIYAGESRSPTYTTLQWNLPFDRIFPEVVRTIINTDCLYRTYGKIDVVATLTWDEYIVPKYHSRIDKLLVDFAENDFKADRYKISVNNFCYVWMAEPPKVFASKKLVNSDPVFIYRQSRDGKLQIPSEANVTTGNPGAKLIAINRYEPDYDRSCKKDELRAVVLDDDYVGKFSQILKNPAVWKVSIPKKKLKIA